MANEQTILSQLTPKQRNRFRRVRPDDLHTKLARLWADPDDKLRITVWTLLEVLDAERADKTPP